MKAGDRGGAQSSTPKSGPIQRITGTDIDAGKEGGWTVYSLRVPDQFQEWSFLNKHKFLNGGPL